MNKLFPILAVAALAIGATACNDDESWNTVDGANPTCQLESTHIRTDQGQTIKIKGTVRDADGISTIDLICPDLYLKKTIDLISIYGEPQKEYALDYTFKLSRVSYAESYPIEVTVTDIAGKQTKETVTVVFDGDFVAPEFVLAPSPENTVILNETGTIYSLDLDITDNYGIDYVVISINAYDLSSKTIYDPIDDHFPMTVEAYGQKRFTYKEDVYLPAEEAAYLVSVEVFDVPAQDQEVRSSKVTGTITVLGGFDFEKMYLADVKTPAELTSDVFGVPMRVDKTGVCQYRARYYCENPNTEIYFIPQKGALSPICFGLDPTDNTKLINSPANAEPLVLAKANTYYEINFNTDSGEYTVEEYTPADYMDPVIWETGSNNLNAWANYVDTGSDDWQHTDDAWLWEFYLGMGTSPNNFIANFAQDPDNKHRYYTPEPVHLEAGTLGFIVTNYHFDGWWNYVTWRVDNETECDIFYYYGGVVKQAYLDWWLGEGVANWKAWSNDEAVRRNIIYGGGGDKWCRPVVNKEGDYIMYFDAHLGRGKLVPKQ